MPVDDLLDAGFDSDHQLLSGFVPGIADDSVSEVAFFEERDVDKSHASGAVAEDEEVAGQFERRVVLQIEFVELCDNGFGDRAFGGSVDSGIDIGEGEGLNDKFLADGLVVDGAQSPHVEGDGVSREAALNQKGVVVGDELFGDGGERDVFAIEKAGEAFPGFGVVLYGSEPVVFGQQAYLPTEEVGQEDCLFGVFELLDDVEGRVGDAATVEFVDNVVQVCDVAVDPMFDSLPVGEISEGPAEIRVPVFGADFHRGVDVEGFSAVYDLIIDGSGLSGDG